MSAGGCWDYTDAAVGGGGWEVGVWIWEGLGGCEEVGC